MRRKYFHKISIFLTAILLLAAVSFVQAQDSVIVAPPDSSVDFESDTVYELADDEEVIKNPAADTASMREIPDSIVRDYQSRKEFEYANDPEYWKKKKKEEQEQKENRKDFLEQVFESTAARVIMYIVLGLVILFVVYRIIVNNSLFYRNRKIKTASEITEEEELLGENLESRLDQAIASGNYRSAVRFLYIKGLQKLDARGWIRYHSQSTNYDYLNQVSKFKVAENFNFLTRVYEYVWYGEFGISQEQFNIVRSNFEKMYKEIEA